MYYKNLDKKKNCFAKKNISSYNLYKQQFYPKLPPFPVIRPDSNFTETATFVAFGGPFFMSSLYVGYIKIFGPPSQQFKFFFKFQLLLLLVDLFYVKPLYWFY